MRTAVEEMVATMATFNDRPTELIDLLESMGAYVFERADREGVLLLIVCEPIALDLVLNIVIPYKRDLLEPFSIEIRGIFKEKSETKGEKE